MHLGVIFSSLAYATIVSIEIYENTLPFTDIILETIFEGGLITNNYGFILSLRQMITGFTFPIPLRV